MNQHNLHNAKVYTQNSGAAADFLATSVQVQIAIKHWLEKLISANPVRVLELGSSNRPHRWQIISSLPTSRQWYITLSDFSLDALPPTATLPNTTNFYFSNKKLDLLTDDFPTTKFDAVLASYVFDAIWFPQDRYINQNNYPGGLIAKIHSAFATCLNPQGVFITIDRTSTRYVPEYELSGPAHFKTENYDLAAQTLRSQGYEVDVLNLNHFLSLAGTHVPLDLSDHSALIVKK